MSKIRPTMSHSDVRHVQLAIEKLLTRSAELKNIIMTAEIQKGKEEADAVTRKDKKRKDKLVFFVALSIPVVVAGVYITWCLQQEDLL